MVTTRPVCWLVPSYYTGVDQWNHGMAVHGTQPSGTSTSYRIHIASTGRCGRTPLETNCDLSAGTHWVMICVIRHLALTVSDVCLKLGCFLSTSVHTALRPVLHFMRYIILRLTDILGSHTRLHPLVIWTQSTTSMLHPHLEYSWSHITADSRNATVSDLWLEFRVVKPQCSWSQKVRKRLYC